MDKKMSKEKVVELLLERINEEDLDKKKSFNDLKAITGYSKRQLIRLNQELLEKPPDEVIKHKNKGRVPTNAALDSEIEFMIKLKAEYPVITIAQFKDIVDEDYIHNPDKKWYVSRYHLKERSYSWYESLFHKQNWKSPVKHRRYPSDHGQIHSIRPPRPRKGELVQIDGTPHDWFNNGKKYCLHLAVDDATSEVLAGYFSEHECLKSYCELMIIILKKYGVPEAVYSDKHAIFKTTDDSLTNFGYAMKDLGVDMIFANTAQAKGRVERMNLTEQNRLVNDIKRFKIETDNLEQLNTWFNDFYVKYTNTKFAYTPLDPHDAFVEIIDGQYDYNTLFTLRFERIMEKNSIFSLNGILYQPIKEETGEIVYIRKGVKVDARFEILTNKISITRYGKRIECIPVGQNSKSRRKNVMDNTKDLNEYYENKRKEK